MYAELSESERFPLLTPAGRKLLHEMRQHPQAPAWNWPNGEQLDAASLEQVQQFASQLQQTSPHRASSQPAWLGEFVDFCLTDVPFYRRRSPPGTPLAAIPSCSRADLAPKVWDFVPDSAPLEQLVVFSSSGTTGLPTQTPASPASASCGIPLIDAAIRTTGVTLDRGRESMALTNIAAYRGAYTTAIVVAYLQESGCIRVNLSPEVWRNASDCPAYLDRFWAPAMLGDPHAFAALGDVDIQRPPQVMVSCITHLSDAFAAQLSSRYGAQVIDIYALTEAGIVAVKTVHGHAVLPPDLHVEILDEHDEPCPVGVVGEIALTGGRNPYLPLLRYRTGDFASLAWHEGRATLVGLEGRRPVLFPTSERVVHSMEVTRLLRKYPLVRYQLHQDEQGAFQFRYRGAIDEQEVHDALSELLGRRSTLNCETWPTAQAPRKTLVYESLHPAAQHAAV